MGRKEPNQTNKQICVVLSYKEITALSVFSGKYIVMCKVYLDVGGTYAHGP